MSLVHIHAPQPDAFGISRQHCPTCEKRRFMFWRSTPYYGADVTCLACGESWQDGERSERPFSPRWRVRAIESARRSYRSLRDGAQERVRMAAGATMRCPACGQTGSQRGSRLKMYNGRRMKLCGGCAAERDSLLGETGAT